MAQVSDADRNEALQLINANKAAIGLSTDDLNNLLVSGSYIDKTTGTRYVYLQQTYKEIPVYNQLQVLAFRNGSLLSKTGERIGSIDQKINIPTGIPSVAASTAVMAAIADRNIIGAKSPVVINTKDNGRKVELSDIGISQENITAQLMWYLVPESKLVKLIWQVYITPTTTADYWLVRIDAANGQPLGADNLTVYCNWDDLHHKHSGSEVNICNSNELKITQEALPSLVYNPGNHVNRETSEIPALADNVNYRVIPFPAEAPSFPLGAHAIRTNPWTAGLANATTLKWHSTAVGTDYNYTRGNNVWAYHDRTNLNVGDPSRSATSTTALPNLTFDFTPDYTQEPVVTSPPNQQFNITNLFYWNNIIHDVMYAYGFDEPGGNFQSNNLGRGGLGNDYVRAEAQDGSGSNNANFSTPADGSLPRMQMYLWTAPNPDRDGDVDNGIIVHEYGHGISNRLTGGPATASCLSNAEQMGEGWSDYYALMFTQDWASSNLNTGFTNPRGIGTYALNQPTTGLGIRGQRYCTDFSINNRVYATTIPSSPHNRGEIWCATLWDMTWNIIQQVGTINPNIYNTAGGGGNVIAMRLVTEGMKLQPCSPGFITGRDAILQADMNLYGGAYQCAIKEAFRRRGMGEGASQGSSNSVNDQVPSFAGGSSSTLILLQSGTSTSEGQNINYTNRLVVGNCGDLVNYKITDTLPANVTFVSATDGGTYNAANRVVSWAVNQAANSTVDYNFVVNINAGAYYPTGTLLNEMVTSSPPALPAGWSTTATPTNNPWVTTNSQSHSAPNSLFTSNITTVNDQILVTTNSLSLPASAPKMSFWGYIKSETSWDGGVVEVSTNGGGSWSDLGPNMISGGYNGTLNSSGNPLSGRAAFHGNSAGFFKTTINLGPYAGQPNVKFRFRFGSDQSVAGQGWWVDDILIEDIAQVSMRSSLYNASGFRLSFSDAVMLIDPPSGCVPPSVNQHPSNATICAEANTSFTVGATGTAPFTYQWQESTSGAGGPWNNISNGGIYSGAITATLTLTGVTTGMNGYQYRCVVTGQCAPTATSNAGILEVSECTVPTVTCPTDINASATSGCNVNVSTPNPTIANTTTLTWAMTGATSDSSPGSGINYVGISSFNIGVTTITYTATNASGSATCSFTVTVADITPAVITCPANITNQQNGKNKCSVNINVPDPDISGNCSVSKLTWAMTGALTLNSPLTGINYVGTQTFPVGVTTVTYTVTNGANNTNTCSFTVTVRNNKCSGSPPLTGFEKTDEATEDELSVKVSPNPSNTYFTLLVQSGSNENVEVAVYTINGRLVQKLNGNVFESFRFGDSYLPGTYIVKVRQGTKEVTLKVVK